ncbi:MAG TPA: SAM-dependent methyltransferase, partial [Verrucomicrobiales bacterium]|nr:SAM-dependent methyltransferase [Verrucomicrobiales bacterium]
MDRQYWDSLADSYEDDLLEISREDLEGALSEELNSLGEKAESVADLGCGPGSLLPLLA